MNRTWPPQPQNPWLSPGLLTPFDPQRQIDEWQRQRDEACQNLWARHERSKQRLQALMVLAPGEQAQQETPPMRGLFEVYLVKPETDTVFRAYVVARDEATARLKAWQETAKQVDANPDDVDILVRRIGDVRAKREGKAE
jgi:hypothetical protein